MNKTQKARHYLKVTPRDIELFKYLFIYKGATAKQIYRDIFNTVSRQNMYARLKKLYNYGLINNKSYWDERHIGVYFVTPKGVSASSYLDKKVQRRETLSANPKHDCALVDIAWMFSQLKSLEFYATENEIESDISIEDLYGVKPCKILHSDALAVFKTNHEVCNYAIEYERSNRNLSRYNYTLRNYYAYPIIDKVIYFTSNDKIKRKIYKVDRKILQDLELKNSKIFVISVTELKKSFTQLKAVNALKECLNFKFQKEIYL